MTSAACVIGIDFGTDSVRSIVADATTGSVLSASGTLSQNCGSLKGSVVDFLDGVRAG